MCSGQMPPMALQRCVYFSQIVVRVDNLALDGIRVCVLFVSFSRYHAPLLTKH